MTATSAEIASSRPLWDGLPPALATALRPEISGLTTMVLDEIQRRIPEYARPRNRNYMHSISRGVEEALNQFVDQIADPATPRTRCERIHRALGRNEMVEGRGLDNLQRAYRIGARLSWRRFMTIGSRAGMPYRTLVDLGEAIIAHIDELANLAADGYLAAQGASRMLARRRRRVLELLVSDPLVAERELEEAASAARWPLPRRVVVAVLDRPVGETGTPRALLLDGLADLESGEPCFVLPADAGERAEADWERLFPGRRLVLSGPVALHDAADALRWARRVMVLVRQRILPDRAVTRCEEHLSSVLLLSDEALSLELAKRRLAPLVESAPQDWLVLARTLLWSIRTGGDPVRIGDALGLPAATVDAQLDRLRPVFGAEAADPETRFELEMALRVVVLLMNPAGTHG
ncbi:PucR-like helix-turn-helix protein [Saccharopolyspora erythraea NRRL 2338]|uniref:Transcriptional regulator, CdaR n=2 Tax=Saccharopolyspora erythraea TaxID=1836 RepID=A4FC93_SACEN|nr:helix-turn-helix domain-containing protein [Saccharopolyspora erythraea]EQD82412.1 regulatory protein [Saccharopolyspora erythraea D]PFG95430.1 PucR-like helix-turn-helix protein [Saccharopolyspora erythraea NRRL 2338]QRK92068.1 helix-turn-helix domain-containing protein [Saccharopolyspora erythraea]CAM01668.1 transcriptional regulator, CdaR [Saccharopolyspora erythraea NRRL 2338]